MRSSEVVRGRPAPSRRKRWSHDAHALPLRGRRYACVRIASRTCTKSIKLRKQQRVPRSEALPFEHVCTEQARGLVRLLSNFAANRLENDGACPGAVISKASAGRHRPGGPGSFPLSFITLSVYNKYEKKVDHLDMADHERETAWTQAGHVLDRPGRRCGE